MSQHVAASPKQYLSKGFAFSAKATGGLFDSNERTLGSFMAAIKKKIKFVFVSIFSFRVYSGNYILLSRIQRYPLRIYSDIPFAYTAIIFFVMFREHLRPCFKEDNLFQRYFSNEFTPTLHQTNIVPALENFTNIVPALNNLLEPSPTK